MGQKQSFWHSVHMLQSVLFAPVPNFLIPVKNAIVIAPFVSLLLSGLLPFCCDAEALSPSAKAVEPKPFSPRWIGLVSTVQPKKEEMAHSPCFKPRPWTACPRKSRKINFWLYWNIANRQVWILTKRSDETANFNVFPVSQIVSGRAYLAFCGGKLRFAQRRSKYVDARQIVGANV